MTKSSKAKTREKSVIEALESLQSTAANSQLDETLMAGGIPELAPSTIRKIKRFSQVIPFERSTFDYEKYCTSLVAASMAKKPRRG